MSRREGGAALVGRVMSQLFRDPGERSPLWWAALANGLLAGHLVPARVRTLGYRALGIGVHPTSLVRPGVIFRHRAVTIGARSTVNYGCVLDNRAPIRIGANVGIGIGVQLITTEHDTSDPLRRAGVGSTAPIVIGDGAYIGSGAVVLAGVEVGQGAVIGAGALVNRDCAPHGFYAGVPARLIRSLLPDPVERHGLE